MTDHIFILIPADIPTGPVKGAYALANSLVENFEVSLVTIKHGIGANARIDTRIRKYAFLTMPTISSTNSQSTEGFL